MKNWYKEYLSSLKRPEAEEFLDIYFFRPIAFVIVKMLYRFPITPNQYSLAAFISGILSAYYFFIPDNGTNRIIGAWFFFFFAVLDCCDGMQARMKKNGSPMGRIIDGLVDWSINAAVYLALFISEYRHGLTSYAWLFLFSGVMKAMNSGIYDNILMEYLNHAEGKGNFLENEYATFKKDLAENQNTRFQKFGKRAYLFLLGMQIKSQKNREKIIDSQKYCEKNLVLLKMWGLIGPAMHILVLFIAFLIQKVEILFLYSTVMGFGWMLIMQTIQKSINQKLAYEA